MTMAQLTSFLGWCTAINIALLAVSWLSQALFRDAIANLAGKMFGISREAYGAAYLAAFANFKVLVVVFNLVPYLALRLI